jgi:bis(5'-nucleosidyl)-tetraphosphatase
MIEKRQSYGIIPFYKGEEGIEVLVVRQTQVGNTFWSFPKGTPEGGESPIETARREVEEEVGLVFKELDETKTFSEEYTFTRDGKRIEKTTTYYLGFTDDKYVTLQEEEIEAAEWLQMGKVAERLTYSETKELFERVKEYRSW